MDANSSARAWFTLMDVQHLQGTKINTWAGLQDGKMFFFQPGDWKWIRAWTVNSDPKCGQPENTMGKQAALLKYMLNITFPPGITPAAPSGYTRGFPTAALGTRDAVLKFRNNPDSPPGLLPVQCLTPNYSIPCDPYLTVTQAATLIPG